MNNSYAIDLLIEKALKIPPVFDIVGLFEIDSLLNRRISTESIYDVLGFEVSIDSNGINHALKHHGNEATEKQQGQIAVQILDFYLIEQIVRNAKKISNAGKSNIGKELILFEKMEKNINYFAVFEIRRIVSTKKKLYKHNRLVLHTLYKRKTPL